MFLIIAALVAASPASLPDGGMAQQNRSTLVDRFYFFAWSCAELRAVAAYAEELESKCSH